MCRWSDAGTRLLRDRPEVFRKVVRFIRDTNCGECRWDQSGLIAAVAPRIASNITRRFLGNTDAYLAVSGKYIGQHGPILS